MEVDCSQKLPVLDIDQVNESYVGSESLRVLASDLWRPSDKLSSETHATGKSWTKLIYSQTWKVDRELGNEHEGNASTMPVDPASSKGCSILSTSSSEVEAAIPKEEPCIDGAGHLENKELHFFSDFQNVKRGGCAEGQGGRQESKNAICKTGNYGPTLVDVEGNKLDKTKGSMDTLSSDNSELSNASNFHGEDYEPHGNFYHPTDIECREGSELIGGNSQDNESRLLTIHKIEESDKQGELRSPGHGYLQEHQTLPLWVKWRGKWQAGFRCPRVDCPLSTLKAKPTHQRKKYISIFFPRTRMYSWVDMLLVCPINKFPEPLAYGTHRRWRKLVKDLSTPRRHVMQKLALAVLNICEQLHTEAVVEDTHRSTTWKEFAKESSHGGGYSSLGKMLLKLQNMILPRYLNKDWLKSSFDFWVQRCCAAQSAESIEILTEELVESVLWSKVDKLWNAPVQPELSPEWKTWKQEAMSCFLISNSQSSFKRVEQINSDISVDGEPKICRKRLKLDVHPHETSISHVEEVSNHQMLSRINRRIIDSRLHNSQGLTELASNCESHKMVAPPQVGTATGSNFLVDRLKDTTRGVEDAELIHNKVRSSKEPILHASDLWNNSNKYRQCLAFVETKGRQCGRWANDGDIYCCVHLNNHFVRKDPHLLNHTPLVEAPMCQGTTTHGTKCKHRSRYGSTFCKKHLFQGNQSSRTADFLLMSSTDLPKRKQQEVEVLESISNLNASYSWDETLLRDAANSTQESHILISEELDEKNCIMKQTKLHNSLPTPVKDISSNLPQCIGHYSQSNVGDCQEFARWHTLYCEKHIPKFLKRARSGKSRIISKDVFISLLKSCSSRNEKLTLHQACELLYRFMKSGLSRQKIVSSGEHAACIIAEASKDLNVGEYLLKLVSCEREKILRLCGLNNDKDQQISSTEINSLSTMNQDLEMTMKCKRCAQEFSGDDMLCRHLIEVHKKEVQQFFRGYACMICMDLFSNRKVLETHVIAKHGVQLLEHSVSLRCMSCSSLFVNLEEFWQHVFSSHSTELRMLNLNQCSWTVEEGEAVHFLSKRRNYFLKRGRVSHSRFWKNFRSAFTFKKHCSLDTLIDVHGSTSMSHLKPKSYSSPSEMAEFGRLSQPDCSIVAEALFSKLKKAKVWPSNLEILSVARSACCRISLEAALVVKYGILPENIYLKAAKLCSELNIQVSWHQEGFVCPRGCSRCTKPSSLSPLIPLPSMSNEFRITDSRNDLNWKMDDSHYILNPEQFNFKSKQKSIIICKDVSFGKEAIPVACVVDEDLQHLLNDVSCSQEPGLSMPWKSFTYVTERLIDPSHVLDTKISQLRCACPHPTCYPENCDHVYLFDNDYDTAVDIHGMPMHGRFPYDDQGRIILKEGYLVYECNSMCSCDITCKNRVLQKGIQVKLEIFRTEKKGWAVRAGQTISRGTFVCEYIGEVFIDAEAEERDERYDSSGCSYFYDIDAHIDSMRCFSEAPVLCVIDATKYGNVSRFINHSCSPNLVNYLVLVESMDCQLAHIGLFADRDIALGEELAYDYRYKLVPGKGLLCLCGAPNCRGRLC